MDNGGQTEADNDDEHEHNELGEAMTSDNDDLMKRRAEERGKRRLRWPRL